MATTHLIGFLQSGLVTSAGVAIASGKVRFYQPGTLTPETVYSDGLGATPLTQPITLSAGGTATVYSLNPLRCIVKDATDVTTLFDLDQADTVSGSGTSIQSATFNNNVAFTVKATFDAWSTSFGGTAGMWKGKIGTTERNVKDMISGICITPQDYGAVGDGVADDTAALVAMAAAQTAGGNPVFFPKGTYKITSAVTFSANAVISGVGRSTTPGSLIVQYTAGAGGLILGARCFVSNLAVVAAVVSAGTGIVAGSGCCFTNVQIGGGISGGSFAVGGNGTSCVLYNSPYSGVIGLTGTWFGDGLTGSSGTVATGVLYVFPLRPSGSPTLGVSSTQNVANGGTAAVPTADQGQTTQHCQIKMSSSGAVAATVTAPSQTYQQLLVLELNNTGNATGVCTFTLSGFKSTAATAVPAASQRIVITYIWDSADNVFLETGRTASFAGLP